MVRGSADTGVMRMAGGPSEGDVARVRLRRLNINLLYALDALLHSPSLTAAAHAIAISQPAMSVKLRQLRDHFGDELVVFAERRQLTALGDALQQRVGRLLREVDDTFNLRLQFDPATARRTVTLAAPEVIEVMFLSRIVPQLHALAPGLQIRFIPFGRGETRSLFDAGADVVIVPERMVDPTLKALHILDHGPASLVWTRHPLAGQSVSRDTYLAASHAAVHAELESAIFGDCGLMELLERRNVVVRTSLHAVLPLLAIGSDLIVTTSSWFAQLQAAFLPVMLLNVDIPRVESGLFAQWQPYRDREPVIRWLVDQVKQCAEGTGVRMPAP